MLRSKVHELAWSLGFVQGILSVLRHDKDELGWFEDRGVTRTEIESLSTCCTAVARAFYVTKPLVPPAERKESAT